MNYCNLVVVARPGDVRREPEEVQTLCAQYERSGLDASRVGQICRLQLPMLEVSATDIRHRLKSGECVVDLLATPVYTYIKQHRLYVKLEPGSEAITENTI